MGDLTPSPWADPKPLGGGLSEVLNDKLHREAARITFLVTLSCVVVVVVVGAVALFVQQYGKVKADAPTENPKP